MTLLDWILVAAGVLFAFVGWRQGLVRGLFSMLGFLGGGLLAAIVVPRLLADWDLGAPARLAITVGSVLVLATLGQSVFAMLGDVVRSRLTFAPVRAVDSVGGAIFSVVALAAVVWLLASAVALVPDQPLARQVRESQVLARIDGAVPPVAREWFGGMREYLDASGFPRVFDGLTEDPGAPVAPGDAALLEDPAIRASLRSVVRVAGPAPDCSATVTGSGFVIAPQRVMTNAHVVAGVDGPAVQVGGRGDVFDAEVVYFDDRLDVAVLEVPGLDAAALRFDADAERGDAAVVAGFPGGGPLKVGAARVRAVIDARGHDIYGGSVVDREVLSLRAQVRPGNSGGPLLAPTGEVLGVVFAASTDDAQTGYALSADQVGDAAAQGSTATEPVEHGTCRH